MILTRVSENLVSVGIGEMGISSNSAETLVTYSLGSCVGVALYDPVKKIGGIIHCMLPLSSADPVKAQANPCLYVDTGMTKFLNAFYERGVEKKNIICKVAGAGSPIDDKGIFQIGERNYAVLRKILWKNNILIKSELILGKTSKTLFLTMETGRTFLRIDGKSEVDL